MLKLIYTETDLHMELLTANLEDWVEQRLLFSNSTGEIIFLGRGTASFLLPTTICEATAINFYLYNQGAKNVTVNCCDFDRVEIGLTGYWLSTDPDSDQGIFVTKILERSAVCDSNRVEFYLWQLWCNGSSQSAIIDGVVN